MRIAVLKNGKLPFGIHLLVVLSISFAFFQQLGKVTSGERTCVASYDGFGYYLYLAALADQGTLDVTKEWAQELQDDYCNGNEAYQLLRRENGHYLNMYHMGLSVVMAPAFAIGHVWAVAADYPTDGMSFPYQVMYVINAWIFVLLGWFYLRKLLLLFCSPLATAVLTLVLLLGTNYFITSVMLYVLQHGYVFTLVAAFLYYLLRYNEEGKYRFIAPLLLGLIVFIRPTHVVLGFLPAILLYDKEQGVGAWIKALFPYALAGFMWQIPQILYWKLIGGSWIEMNLHINEIVLFDAHFSDFLFSYRKGWLLYTPLFLVLPFGFWFLRKHDKRLFVGLLIPTLLSIWLMAGWECWWYASSFGQRPIVDIYPVLAIPVALLLTRLQPIPLKVAVFTFVGLCVLLNLFQSEQYRRGILADDRMTKDQYWAIFGVLDPDEVNPKRLRINESDPYWTEHTDQYNELGYHMEKRILFDQRTAFVCQPQHSRGFEHITLLDELPTDETQLEASFEWEAEDTTGSATLCMEIANKHNVYIWNTIELALQKPHHDSMVYRFSLPTLHHRYDYLQIYVVNSTGKALRLNRFKLTATSLIREKK